MGLVKICTKCMQENPLEYDSCPKCGERYPFADELRKRWAELVDQLSRDDDCSIDTADRIQDLVGRDYLNPVWHCSNEHERAVHDMMLLCIVREVLECPAGGLLDKLSVLQERDVE